MDSDVSTVPPRAEETFAGADMEGPAGRTQRSSRRICRSDITDCCPEAGTVAAGSLGVIIMMSGGAIAWITAAWQLFSVLYEDAIEGNA